MKRIVILILCMLMCVPALPADQSDKQKRVFGALATIIDGDTVPMFELMEVTIENKRVVKIIEVESVVEYSYDCGILF